MVHGIDRFREYFQDYACKYIFIGGTACDIILGQKDVEFRATKDLDMVLIIEAVNDSFVRKFISFISDAGYQHIVKGKVEQQFCRFEKPDNTEFPYMIELFGRRPDYLFELDNNVAPIHVSDEVISLSAILLDDEYYSLLLAGKTEVDGLTVLDLEHLILFKIKAWLDLCGLRDDGVHIDQKNIKKHKNDVLRLGANITPNNGVHISGKVLDDVKEFTSRVAEEPIDVKTLGISGVTFQDILKRITECYVY